MSPDSLDPRAPSAYRRRALPFLLPCYLMFSSGVGALLDPADASRTVVAQVLPGRLELLWIVAYVIASVLIAAGLLWPKPVVEVVGHYLAIYALLLNLMAVLLQRGIAASGLAPAVFLLVAFILSVRIYDLHQRARGVDRRVGSEDRASRIRTLERSERRADEAT